MIVHEIENLRSVLTMANATSERRGRQRDELKGALIAMVYVHTCNCGDEIPAGQCARCRAVKLLGFDPMVTA